MSPHGTRFNNASLLIPAVTLVCIVLVSVFESSFADGAYWGVILASLILLAWWKFLARRRLVPIAHKALSESEIAVIRPYAFWFIAVYLITILAVIGYAWALWYYQLSPSWTLCITFIALWFIKREVWGIAMQQILATHGELIDSLVPKR